jgi:autotransporter-associated beta strand protein
VFWSAGTAGNYIPDSQLSGIIINGGGLILQSSFTFDDRYTRFSSAAIGISTFLSYSPTNGTDAQTFSNSISGNGQLIVNGGTLTLAGDNTYIGSTIISNGTLALIPGGRITTTPIINLSAGATLDATGAGGLTLVSGQTLNGNGRVNGDLDVSDGAIIAPGFSTGALTVNGDLTIEGTVAMDIDKVGGTNDVLTASNVTYGGTLMVNFLSTPPALNDSYRLFVSTGATYSGAFSSIVPETPGSGLAWDTNSLAVNGTLKVTQGAVTSPSTNANITKVTLAATNLIVHGTNNNVPNTNFHYVVLTATNLATALSNWTPVSTNGFNPDGTFDYTNPVIPGTPRQFIDVQTVP